MKSILANIQSPTLTEKLILPIIVALITYLLFRKLDEWKKRRSFSKLGIAIIDTLIEEVEAGIVIFKNMLDPNNNNTPLLPKNSWDKMNTIPDEVLLRIIEVSKNVKPKAFPPSSIRIHCKNYFTHMTQNFENIYNDSTARKTKGVSLILNSKYLESAENVLIMLIQTKLLLTLNSKRWFPK